MLAGADIEDETVELTLPLWDFSDFGKRLKAYRKKVALTQEAFASLIGMSSNAVRSWEQGKAKPPYALWRQCNKLFDEALSS